MLPAPAATRASLLAASAGRSPDATTAQRYEIKFWASEEQAAEMLRVALMYMDVDPFCKNGPQRNISLYLDSPNRSFYEQHIAHLPSRCKLRVRTYDDPTGPAFLEVKRRVKAVTSKRRTITTRAIARELVAGRFEAAASLKPSPDLMEFLFLHQRYVVEPVLLVSARRLALRSVGDGGRFRMTLDRDVRYQRPSGTDLTGRPRAWTPVDLTVRSGHGMMKVLFEMKFADAAPGWLGPAIEMLRLRLTSYSKYVAAMSQYIAENEGWNPARGEDDGDDDPDGG